MSTSSERERIDKKLSGMTNEGEGRKNTLVSLQAEKKQKEGNQAQLKTSYHAYAPLGGLLFIYFAIFFLILAFARDSPGVGLSLLGYFCLFAAIGCFVLAVYDKSEEKRLRTQIEDLAFEIELANYPLTDDEQKSERLFRRSEREVSKYYGLNLIENRSLLYVGVLCIVAGLAIVAFTLAMVFFGKGSDFDVWTKGIVAVVGALSGIMVNFVGAIYLKMYAQSSEAFGQFHDRLVRTNELFPANMLITRIAKEDGPLEKGAGRQALLAALAKNIVEGAMRTPSQPAASDVNAGADRAAPH